jgi:hypothetical protein
LIQIRVYDKDAQRAAATARLVKGLWKVMPAELEVQNVDIAGGPTYQVDPDVPNLTRYLLTGWVTVMNETRLTPNPQYSSRPAGAGF